MESWRRPSKYFPEHGPASAGGVVRAILAASVLAAMPIKGTRERSRRRAQPLTSPRRRREVCLRGDSIMAQISEYSIVTYERRPGHWRAAITPMRRSGIIIRGRTVNSFVTPDDSSSEPDAKFAAEQIIIKL